MRIRSRFGRRVAAVAISLVAAGMFAATSGAPASAADYDGNCETGEVCLWYLVGYQGASADFYNSVSNYNNWHFYNSPLWLANNTESAKNRASYSCVDFFDNANYSGAIAWLESRSESGNFEGAKNRIESHKFVSAFPNRCELP